MPHYGKDFCEIEVLGSSLTGSRHRPVRSSRTTMPNGYSWLAKSEFVTHRYDHWVVQTGSATEDGDEMKAFREPDAIESRLIDVMTMKPQQSSALVSELPSHTYKEVLFGAEKEGTCRSKAPEDRKAPTRHVIASAWETAEDGTVRFLDGIAVECGVEHSSSVLIVLKTTRLCEKEPEGPKRPAEKTKMIYEVQVRLALRQVIDTTVTMPKCRAWNGSYPAHTLSAGNKALVEEVVQRSLVEGDAYSNPNADATSVVVTRDERSTGIWTEILQHDTFCERVDLNALD